MPRRPGAARNPAGSPQAATFSSAVGARRSPNMRRRGVGLAGAHLRGIASLATTVVISRLAHGASGAYLSTIINYCAGCQRVLGEGLIRVYGASRRRPYRASIGGACTLQPRKVRTELAGVISDESLYNASRVSHLAVVWHYILRLRTGARQWNS